MGTRGSYPIEVITSVTQSRASLTAPGAASNRRRIEIVLLSLNALR